MGCQRHVLDGPGHLRGVSALGFGDETELGTERGRVAHVADLRRRHGWDQPDPQGARDRDVIAEAAGQHQLVEIVGRETGHVQQHDDTGGDRALGELDLADVVMLLRSEEHTSELQSLAYLVCRLLLEKKKKKKIYMVT